MTGDGTALVVGEYSCAFGVGADRDMKSFFCLATELSGKVLFTS